MKRSARQAIVRWLPLVRALPFALLALLWAATGARIGFHSPTADYTVSAWWVAIPFAALAVWISYRLANPRFAENRKQALKMGYGPMSYIFRGRP